MIFNIPRTIDVVCACIEKAENEVRTAIIERYPGIAEPEITLLFRDRLHDALSNASQDGEIADAFAQDFQIADSHRDWEAAVRRAQGLVAAVSWHPQHIEGRTGGDFGLLLVRPQLERDIGGGVNVIAGEKAGLLVQAKRQKYQEHIGPFTDSQNELSNKRLRYASLVLYRFTDVDNRILDPFHWEICRGKSMAHTMDRLGKKVRKNLALTTAQVIRGLDEGNFGTNDTSEIEANVIPVGSPTMKLEIGWKEWQPIAETTSSVQRLEEVRIQIHLQN